MSVLAAVIVTLVAIVLLAGITRERMRAYGLGHKVLEFRTIAIGGGVTLARGWLAWRGVGGVETSVVFAVAAVAAITDLQCGYVFDRVSLAGGAALIAVEMARGDVAAGLLGGAAGALALAIPWALSRARGMGLGDVKLAGVLGCGLGSYGVMQALCLAFVIGAIAGIACIVMRGRSRGATMPFAPFLALGALISAGSTAL